MPRERLIALLDEVRDELERADAAGESELDDETAAKLRAVDGDIRGWLDDEDDDDEESFVERTQEAIARFEVEHPTLTAVLNRIADTLAKMGI